MRARECHHLSAVGSSFGHAVYTETWCRIRYPDPAIKVNDTVKIDLSTGEYIDCEEARYIR